MARNLSSANVCVLFLCFFVAAFGAAGQDCDPDETPPVVTIDGPDPLIGTCHVPLQLPAASAEDECDGELDVYVADLGGLDLADPQKGPYTVTYEATDEAEVTRTVNVVDPSAPEIALEGEPEMTVECGET
ncbi:MAG TPA: hypothetical protein ENN29_14030, partial [Candidatus Hydrogenedentes bacterium]|nr:hypothetical protein [Candidatus Hydrogenedentota bacterium]